MLSQVSERKMRLVRGALALGFLVLIASLFWDPMSAELTQPDNLASPFHVGEHSVTVQDHVRPQAPYQMTNRIWWTMLVPALPLFFMVTGHETWRRICPLSFVSQIPRYLGWNRTRSLLSRRSGKVETQLALVDKGGFWRRHVWEIQFGLFFLALNARILFLNADRTALGLFLLATLALAFVTGLLWGGKTWCNYICPVAIVQKIYTEPRGGLFESRAHAAGGGLTQSMCRTSTPDGDRSACVGCTAPCPDIDIERSYWENLGNPRLPYIYYGFFGLILGFYGWYFLYAGSWDYYFSGAWTHDPDQLGRLLEPGVAWSGDALAIPVIVSTPLILGAAVGIAMAAGKLCETLYRAAARRTRAGLSDAEITNRCLAFTAWLSINTFYLFGGRPNLMMLPGPAQRLADILIVALTTIWFWRAIQRSPARYRREGLASSLLEQLRKLPVDIGRFLEGRKIDDLSPDEIYVLAKTLPGFSRDQRMRAYRNILRDAVRKGDVDPVSSLEVLSEIRAEIGVTADEHREALQDLEIDGDIAQGVDESPATTENWLRIESYQRWLEPLLVARFGKGQSLSRILEELDAVESLDEYRAIYQISESEHKAVVGVVAGQGGPAAGRQARLQLDLLAGHVSLIFGLRRRMLSGGPGPAATLWRAIGALLIANARTRAATLYRKLFAILVTLGDSAQAQAIAVAIARLSGADIEAALAQPVVAGARTTWAQTLPASLLDLSRGGQPTGRIADSGVDGPGRPPSLVGAPDDLAAALSGMVAGADPVLGALALAALSGIDPPGARDVAASLSRNAASAHGLMAEVIQGLQGEAVRPDSNPDSEGPESEGLTLFILTQPEGRHYSFNQDRVSIGGCPTNDIVVAGPAVLPHHAVIRRTGSGIEVSRADPGAAITINGAGLVGDRAEIDWGARLGLLAAGTPGPVLVVEWPRETAGVTLEPLGLLPKLLWLSQADMFRATGLRALADIAAFARAWRCGEGAWLCRDGDGSRELVVLASGSADVFRSPDLGHVPSGKLGRGAFVDVAGLIFPSHHGVSVRISSPTANVLTINGLRLRGLMEQDARLSLAILGAVHESGEHSTRLIENA